MKSSKRWWLVALAVLWVSGIAIWSYGFLIPSQASNIDTATSAAPSATPTQGDVDDAFRAFDDPCVDIDWQSLNTAIGYQWSSQSPTDGMYSKFPQSDLGCNSVVPNNIASSVISIGVYDSASSAIVEHDNRKENIESGDYDFDTDFTSEWSRSIRTVATEQESDSFKLDVVLTLQADNLYCRFGVSMGALTEPASEQLIESITNAMLEISSQVQDLASD